MSMRFRHNLVRGGCVGYSDANYSAGQLQWCLPYDLYCTAECCLVAANRLAGLGRMLELIHEAARSTIYLSSECWA